MSGGNDATTGKYEVCIGAEEPSPFGVAFEGAPPQCLSVHKLQPNFPAAVKGVSINDILLAVNGLSIQQCVRKDLINAFSGRPVALQFQRQEAALQQEQDPNLPAAWRSGYRRSGLEEGAPLYYEVEAGAGDGILGVVPDGRPPHPVQVATVIQGSIAASQGVLVGDVITKVNGKIVSQLTKKQACAELHARPVLVGFTRSDAENSGVFQLTFDTEARVMGILPSSWPPEPVVVGSVVVDSTALASGVQARPILPTVP